MGLLTLTGRTHDFRKRMDRGFRPEVSPLEGRTLLSLDITTLEVSADIDGHDQLIIQGNTLQWHHFDKAAVGRLNGKNEPTLISTTHDGVPVLTALAWTPDWPGHPPGDEIRNINAFSSPFTGLFPAAPLEPSVVSLVAVQAREHLAIAQYPSALNGYTTILDFNDDVTGGDAVYDARLTFSQADLSASIKNITVHPEQAQTLQLNSIYGGEHLVVPVTVTNAGTALAKGNVDVSYYLSPSPTYDANTAIPVQAGNLSNQPINLRPSQAKTFSATVTIPNDSRLTPGSQWYVLAKVTSDISESDASNGQDTNNVAATQQYEFLRNPGRPSVFRSGGTYIGIVRDTLNNVNPFRGQDNTLPGPPSTTDGLHFTAAFESPGGYDNPNLAPYLDNANPPNPTIGLGLNLNALEPAVEAALAADVRTYYQAHSNMPPYNNTDTSKLTDDQVIQMLRNQAEAGNAPPAITTEDAQALYGTTYATAQQTAIAFVGQSSWTNLSSTAQIALTDIAFNIGANRIGNFNNLRADLQAAQVDYILAGFDMLDSIRTEQVQRPRSLAEYEYMVFGLTNQLGRISAT